MSRMAFSSKISSLWQPMFRRGMGFEAGSVAFPASPPPLQRQLAAVGIAAADMPCGRRPPVAGFVIAVATMVKSAATDGHASGILQDHLQVSVPGYFTAVCPVLWQVSLYVRSWMVRSA